MENLFLQTPQSLIREKIILKYASLNSMVSKPENIILDANFKKCKISISDILLFAPMLDKNLLGYQKSIVNVNAELKGLLRDY